MIGEAKRAYGKLLHLLDNTSGTKLAEGTTIPFAGKANQFENIDEVKLAGMYPDDKKIIVYVNRDMVAKARNRALTQACDDAGVIKPTVNNDADIRLKDMIKILKASGLSEEDATSVARKTLKMDTPADEESDDDTDEE